MWKNKTWIGYLLGGLSVFGVLCALLLRIDAASSAVAVQKQSRLLIDPGHPAFG